MTRWGTIGLLLAMAALPLAGCQPPAAAPSPGGDLQARYEQTEAANQRLQSENAALQAQLAQQAQQQSTYTVAADLLFAPGSFDIMPNGRAVLDDIAGRLREVKNNRIVVYGHSDDQGIGPPLKKLGINTNMDLSVRRAEAVAGYLTGHGVAPRLVASKGLGDTKPVAPNSSAAGRAQNRRIEIAVEGPGG